MFVWSTMARTWHAEFGPGSDMAQHGTDDSGPARRILAATRPGPWAQAGPGPGPTQPGSRVPPGARAKVGPENEVGPLLKIHVYICIYIYCMLPIDYCCRPAARSRELLLNHPAHLPADIHNNPPCHQATQRQLSMGNWQYVVQYIYI